jgi:hypothetical protein
MDSSKPVNLIPRRKQVAEIVLSRNLSPDGRDWLVLALDPYHDYPRQIAGYPDADNSATVVSCYQYEYDLSKPAGVAGNWDAHVFTMPFLRAESFDQCIANNGPKSQRIQTAAGVPTLGLGPLSIIAADAGQKLFPEMTGVFNPTNPGSYQVNCLTDAFPGRSRVIGWGFELVNTTAEMYKQGALTAYRMPQAIEMDWYNQLNQPGTQLSMQPAWTVMAPPSSADMAMKFGTTSLQWGAAEGAYITCTQSTINNPLTSPAGLQTVIMQKTDEITGQYCLMSPWGVPAAIAPPAASPGFSALSQKVIPFNTHGVFLTGLSNQTTFRVKMKMYVERAPSYVDTSLAVLATPSAAYDSKALALYSAALCLLPVAVKVNENSAGDWFRRVLGALGAAAPLLGGILGGPPGAAIGATVGGFAPIISSLIPEEGSSKRSKGVSLGPAGSKSEAPVAKPKKKKRSKVKKA